MQFSQGDVDWIALLPGILLLLASGWVAASARLLRAPSKHVRIQAFLFLVTQTLLIAMLLMRIGTYGDLIEFPSAWDVPFWKLDRLALWLLASATTAGFLALLAARPDDIDTPWIILLVQGIVFLGTATEHAGILMLLFGVIALAGGHSTVLSCRGDARTPCFASVATLVAASTLAVSLSVLANGMGSIRVAAGDLWLSTQADTAPSQGYRLLSFWLILLAIAVLSISWPRVVAQSSPSALRPLASIAGFLPAVCLLVRLVCGTTTATRSAPILPELPFLLIAAGLCGAVAVALASQSVLLRPYLWTPSLTLGAILPLLLRDVRTGPAEVVYLVLLTAIGTTPSLPAPSRRNLPAALLLLTLLGFPGTPGMFARLAIAREERLSMSVGFPGALLVFVWCIPILASFVALRRHSEPQHSRAPVPSAVLIVALLLFRPWIFDIALRIDAGLLSLAPPPMSHSRPSREPGALRSRGLAGGRAASPPFPRPKPQPRRAGGNPLMAEGSRGNETRGARPSCSLEDRN